MNDEKTPKICPYIQGEKNGQPFRCVRDQCVSWTTVYTVEYLATTGCIRVFEPQMTDGLLRV